MRQRRSPCLIFALCAWSCAEAAAPEGGSSEALSASNDFGTLHGTLQLPKPAKLPFEAVVIVPGSGAIDRNGNADPMLRTDAYEQLALGLAAHGIGSLRYDKAGIGESVSAAPANEAELRFEMGAHDAALFMTKLRADPRIGRISWVGHSEGSLLAMLAQELEPADAIASLEGAGRPIADVLHDQLEAQISDPQLRTQAFDILAQLERGERVDTVPSSLVPLFRPSVQPYLISWMAYDPAAEFSAIAVPSLIVQGTSDLQVSLSDAEQLAAANPAATVRTIEGMNHTLKLDDAATLTEQAARSYVDPKYPLAPELVDALVRLSERP